MQPRARRRRRRRGDRNRTNAPTRARQRRCLCEHEGRALGARCNRPRIRHERTRRCRSRRRAPCLPRVAGMSAGGPRCLHQGRARAPDWDTHDRQRRRYLSGNRRRPRQPDFDNGRLVPQLSVVHGQSEIDDRARWSPRRPSGGSAEEPGRPSSPARGVLDQETVARTTTKDPRRLRRLKRSPTSYGPAAGARRQDRHPSTSPWRCTRCGGVSATTRRRKRGFPKPGGDGSW